MTTTTRAAPKICRVAKPRMKVVWEGSSPKAAPDRPKAGRVPERNSSTLAMWKAEETTATTTISMMFR